MDDRIQVVAILGAVGPGAHRLEIVRRRRLMEARCCGCSARVVILGLAVSADALKLFARRRHPLPPNALFFIAVGFVLVLLLHFSVAVSRLADQ